LIPIQNNPPLVGEPDVYLHWPPLLTWSLALAFRLFGTSESTTHLFMLAVLLGSASIVSLIAARLYGTPGGLLAGLVFLTAPVTLRFSFVAVPVNLSLLFLLLALYFATLRHERRENRLTLLIATFGCFYLAVLTTWEAALAVPGFVIGAWLAVDRQSRLPALRYAGAALLALITIFCIYFISRPDQLQELWHVVRYRAGIDEYQPTHLTVYQIEKALNENRAKLSESDVKAVEAALADAKKALEEGGAERITKATDSLNQVSNKAFESMYKSAGQPGGGGGGGGNSSAGSSDGGAKPDGDVIDAEYVDADEKKNKG